MPKFPYQFFEEYVVRTPFFLQSDFIREADAENFSEEFYTRMSSNVAFKEAVYLASPDLSEEIDCWLNGKANMHDSKSSALKLSILKYYARMSTRCTPFGLFSGVGTGNFTDGKKICERENLMRETKLDMHLLVALSNTLEKNSIIRKKLRYQPNNTIYHVGKNIRYIEYKTIRGKREYIISSAPFSEELKGIINFSSEGETMENLILFFTEKNIDRDEAEGFIEELIKNQVLVSELEPIVSGFDYADLIISVLERINAKEELKILLEIKHKLTEIDGNLINPAEVYLEIEELIKSLHVEYEKKYLFQTDLYFNEKHSLDFKWKKEIKKAVNFLNKISVPEPIFLLEQFKKSFYERYEDQEMPLSFVLDTEVGIGYRQNMQEDIHEYLDDLVLPNPKKIKNVNIGLNSFQIILNEKLQQALMDRNYTLVLNDVDFKDLKEDYSDLPDTISVLAEIVSATDSEQILIKSIGGSSAANLLGRFSSANSKISYLTKTIANTESLLKKDQVLAEIIHLPEARIGNILRRPSLRHYEIPYLAQSASSVENQISVNDLYISIKNNRILLKSKSLNQEVLPFLTNAHNYHYNSLPLYNFLCDLQSQNKRTGLALNIGGLSKIYTFLPRIQYDEIILSKARWKISFFELKHLTAIDSGTELISEIKIWRQKKIIPQWIQLVQSDNVLVINLGNQDMIRLFLRTVKNEGSIMIEEFLDQKQDKYKCEYIFPLHKIFHSAK